MSYESLHQLIAQERAKILERWADRIRCEPTVCDLDQGELWDHLPLFLEDLVKELAGAVPGEPGERKSGDSFRPSVHGRQRLRDGFNIDAVVREYGVLGDVIFGLAESLRYQPSHAESRVVLRELTRGASQATAAYSARRDEEQRKQSAKHLAFVAHELRNRIASASSAMLLLSKGTPERQGRAIDILSRSIRTVTELIDNVLVAQSLESDADLALEKLQIEKLIADARLDASPGAELRNIEINLELEPGEIEGDRRLLFSAISNILRNAVKFTLPGRSITVRNRFSDDWLVIEFEDSCGGLPPGKADELFRPFVQKGKERSGFGLGLAIAEQAVHAHRGKLSVRDVPGDGCVFEIELPIQRV